MSAFPDPLSGPAAPLPVDNVDTDIIIPSREIRGTGRSGLADGLFAPWRYTDAAERVEDSRFVLNQPRFRQTQILVVGANFGCGSSREHAVWALTEFGIKAIVAQSFAPIFRANCVTNFILPILLPDAALRAIAGEDVTIELAAQSVRCQGRSYSFAIDAEAKHMIAFGLDAIDLTLRRAQDIATWTAEDRRARPWIYLSGEGSP